MFTGHRSIESRSWFIEVEALPVPESGAFVDCRLRQEELSGQRGPIFVGNLCGQVIDGRPAVLRERAQSHRHAPLQAAGGFLCPPASQRTAEQVAEIGLGIGGLDGHQPAFAVRIFARQLGILNDGLVDVGHTALDRRKHIDGGAIAMQRPHFLSLANPLAALRGAMRSTLPVSLDANSSMPMRTRLGLSLKAQVWPGWKRSFSGTWNPPTRLGASRGDAGCIAACNAGWTTTCLRL